MTDNRTNEPTPEQVEAAAKAIWERSAKIDDPFWDGGALDYGIKQIYRADARAALVAAQGAAPQAEAYDHCCQHPKCPGGSLCCCVSEQRLRDCWNQWREEIAGYSREAFRDGYQAGQNDPAPWLAATQRCRTSVTREQILEVVAPFMHDEFVQGQEYPADEECADAVLALLNGDTDD